MVTQFAIQIALQLCDRTSSLAATSSVALVENELNPRPPSAPNFVFGGERFRPEAVNE
jgi:hypothetical protein